MRPCDDTFGLVLGNRRKAVFAFKGLFCEERSSRFRFWAVGFCHVFRKCGEKSKLAERTPIFANKTAAHKVSNLESGRQASVFHRTFELRTRLIKMFVDWGSGI